MSFVLQFPWSTRIAIQKTAQPMGHLQRSHNCCQHAALHLMSARYMRWHVVVSAQPLDSMLCFHLPCHPLGTCLVPCNRPSCQLQHPAAARQKDKFVPLGPKQPAAATAVDGGSSSTGSIPGPWTVSGLTTAQRGGGVDFDAAAKPTPTIFEDLDGEGPTSKGRITAMTLAEGLDRKKIEKLLKVGWVWGFRSSHWASWPAAGAAVMRQQGMFAASCLFFP